MKSTETKEKFYTGRYDIVFKKIFSDIKNKELLRVFLESVLERKVYKIELIKLDIEKRYLLEKGRIVDFLAKVDGDIVHIELNSTNRPYTNLRNFSYFTSIVNNHIIRGQEYDIKTNFINIELTYGLGKKIKEKCDIILRDEEIEGTYEYLTNFKVRLFNMDKIMKYYKENKEEKIEKYKYLIMLSLNKEELDKFEGKDKYMSEYEENLVKMNMNPKYRPFLSNDEDYVIVKNTERSIGRDEGIQDSKIEIAKNMINKNYSVDEIASITLLPINKIKKLMVN